MILKLIIWPDLLDWFGGAHDECLCFCSVLSECPLHDLIHEEP